VRLRRARTLYTRYRTYSGLLFILLFGLLSLGFAPSTPAGTADDLQEAVLDVTLTPEGDGETMVVLRKADGAVYLDEKEFEQLRIRLPETKALDYEGRHYYSPAAIRGSHVSVDEARQRLLIILPAAALDTTHLSVGQRRSPAITPASPGGFLNYQVYGQQVEGATSGGMYGELGLFAAAGVITSTAIGRDGNDQASLIRLDTTYTRDFPDQLETLNLGDAISDPGSWGDSVRYAGVRWSRNFALRPDLLTTPLLTTNGTATVPSTVDIFVNNQLVSTSQTPAGPFVIDRLPAVSGTGDVSVVVRDALGREQVVTQSFYSSNSLLAPGLTQYSFNLGQIRNDYATASDHYGDTLGEASYRRGINDSLTLEGHAEYLVHDAHAAGLDAAIGIGKIGVLNLTSAFGGDGSGSGWLTGIGVERRASRLSFVASNYWAGSNFAQVGQPLDPSTRVRERSLVQTGMSFGRFGSASLAYVRQVYRDTPTQQTMSFTQSVSLGRSGTLNLTLTRTLSAAGLPGQNSPSQNATSVYLIYVLPLGGRSAVSATALGGSGSGAPPNALQASLTESPPVGPGSGYRLTAATNGDYDADWRQQFKTADLEVEAAQNNGVSGRSAYLSGAVTFLDGQTNATRQVNGSFAMVDVAGLAGIPVYVENQLTAHTDATGRALLYNLRPYEANHISIQPTELPLDTTIAASSEIVAPPYRSGVVARFPVEHVRGGTFRLVTEAGKPVPVGAQVKLKDKFFPVVLDGLVYVTGFDHGLAAEASWPGGHCSFRLDPPPPGDPLPDMGVVTCRTDSAGGARPQ
jgi:outer membrane usher protein